jgi:hypothetical protein
MAIIFTAPIKVSGPPICLVAPITTSYFISQGLNECLKAVLKLFLNGKTQDFFSFFERMKKLVMP